MNKKLILGSLLLFIGLTIIFSTSAQITGFAITEELGYPKSLGIGILFFLIGLAILNDSGLVEIVNEPSITTRNGRIGERKPYVITKVGPANKIKDDTPILIDTNYLINSTKSSTLYQRIMNGLENAHENGYPIIISKRVKEELSHPVRDLPSDERERRKNLLTAIGNYSVTMESYDENWKSKEKTLMKTAESIMNKTAKAQTYRFMTEKYVNGNSEVTPQEFFKRQGEKIHPDFNEAYWKAEREIKQKGNKRYEQILKRFAPSKADAEILADSLYLSLKGRVYDNKLIKDAVIVSDDRDFSDALKVIRDSKDQYKRFELSKRIRVVDGVEYR